MGRYFSTGIGRLFFYIYICLPRFLTFYIGTLAWVKWYRTDVLKHINAMAECAATASAWWQQFGQFKYYRVVWYDSDLCDGHIQSQCLQRAVTSQLHLLHLSIICVFMKPQHYFISGSGRKSAEICSSFSLG